MDVVDGGGRAGGEGRGRTVWEGRRGAGWRRRGGIPIYITYIPIYLYNNNNKRPLTPKSMPPAGDEHAKLKN